MKKLLLRSKTIVCLFAHPDDESFGPGGAIAELAKQNEIYVICATRGERGGDHLRIANVREQELRTSSKTLGVKDVFFLGFEDGSLSNSIYHDIANAAQVHIDRLRPEVLLTFEPRGISGHIDHIVLSMISSFLFEKLPYVKLLLSYCHDEEQIRSIRSILKTYFVFFPPGYKKSQIDYYMNTSSVWDIRKKAIVAHQSQRKDVERMIKIFEPMAKREYFLARKK